MCRTRMGKHRKWRDIMVLEVQDGGEGLRHFYSRDIQWMPICVKNDSTSDLCATIPLGRLDAFVRGESLREDKNGEACHGIDDTNNELRSQFAPNLSNECKTYIERLLLMDVSVDAIVDRHLDDPVFRDMLKKRDSFMKRKDVINATTRVRSIQSRKHVHDATSILEWKNKDEANFFFFLAATRGACCMGCDIKEQDRGYPGVVDGVVETRKGKEA
ncbi:hypothetical protein SUGI_1009700 [Cryptomeria japonica]|nr:hypothetical protein SUGI_1009700 [Cryptomeria japonica]